MSITPFKHIVNITVPQSGGQSLTTKWGITPTFGIPCIYAQGGTTPSIQGIPSDRHSLEVYVYLLRNDIPVEEIHNEGRLGLAGFNGNPGTIKVRGQDLGEIWGSTNYWGITSYSPTHPRTFTNGEVHWLRDHVTPTLKDYFTKHKKALWNDARKAWINSIKFRQNELIKNLKSVVRQSITEVKAL